MFELRAFVEDKNLSRVMWALDGLVAGMPQVLPVRDAVVKEGKVQSIRDGSIREAFLEKVRQLTDNPVTPSTLGQLLIESGSSIQERMHANQTATQLARKAGLIQSTKLKGIWALKKEKVNG